MKNPYKDFIDSLKMILKHLTYSNWFNKSTSLQYAVRFINGKH